MYFFPSRAAVTAFQQLMIMATLIPQFIVTFECGYCPKGLAGALIKYLIANEMEPISPGRSIPTRSSEIKYLFMLVLWIL